MNGALAERFSALVSPEPNTGCFLWFGSVNPKGYGRFCNQQAHRLAVEFAGRSVPDDMEIDHTCRVRCCVNPDHLDVVTHAENLRRKLVSPTCPNGHSGEFSVRAGKRVCRACGRARNNAKYVPRGVRRRGRSHLTELERAQLRALVAEGVSWRATARLMNVSAPSVWRILRG